MLVAAILAAGLAVAAVVAWATGRVTAAITTSTREAGRARLVQLIAAFSPGIAAAAADPRALLVWHPLAQAARGVLPDEFAALDRASGHPFPFSREQVDAAHASWTAAWLAWEQSHDAEFKLKAQVLGESLGARTASAVGRAQLDGVERERVERYQQRYEEYTRVAKALQRLNQS